MAICIVSSPLYRDMYCKKAYHPNPFNLYAICQTSIAGLFVNHWFIVIHY